MSCTEIFFLCVKGFFFFFLAAGHAGLPQARMEPVCVCVCVCVVSLIFPCYGGTWREPRAEVLVSSLPEAGQPAGALTLLFGV